MNPFIVEVAEALQEKGVEVGKFIPIVEIPLPNKPYDIATNKESRHRYRRDAADVRNKNAQSFKRSCRTRMTMEAVKRFKDRDAFFIPHSFDYRGRTYPVPAFLTAQDTDFGKSLLQFAEPAFMTPSAEGWLAFQCATTYGLSKSTLKERLEWAKDNVDLITRVATDPLGSIGEWGDPETVDEPWSFLAAAEEYYHCVITADRQFTSFQSPQTLHVVVCKFWLGSVAVSPQLGWSTYCRAMSLKTHMPWSQHTQHPMFQSQSVHKWTESWSSDA